MAAISSIYVPSSRGGVVVREGTAQADTGQTDWVTVPSLASVAMVQCDLTAVAGTTPIMTPGIRFLGPSADDARLYTPATLTGTLTAAGQWNCAVGSGVTEQLAIGTADCAILVPSLPDYLGIVLTLDRGTGDETYTYKLSVRFS